MKNNKLVVINAIGIIFLFLSINTVVPKVNGETIVENLENLRTSYLNRDGIIEKIQKFSKKSFKGLIVSKIFDRISLFTSKFDIEFGNLIEKDGFVSKILSVLMLALILPFMILKSAIYGFFGLVSGLVKLIVSVVKLSLLTLAGVQGALLITSLFIIFMGYMSKVGFNVFSKIAAPIFSIIVLRIIPTIGKMLGGISLIIHSILSLLIAFAIPIAIVAILLILYVYSNQESEDNSEIVLI